jgi:hypothetical protein
MASARRPRLDPKEAEIQQTCTELLQLDGWRALRTDPTSDAGLIDQIRARVLAHPQLAQLRHLILPVLQSSNRGKGFGEPGMPDYLYIRYDSLFHYAGSILWIEWKRLKGKAEPHQKIWHAAERKRGATVVVAGEDFHASIEGFWNWYVTADLLVNKGLKLWKRSVSR